MSLASLEAFLARVQEDPNLRERLATAPDAASVAAIARRAGFSVSERDLWQATAAAPEDQTPSKDLQPSEGPGAAAEGAAAAAGGASATAGGAGATAGGQRARPLPDPWFPEEEPLTRFVHQAQGDPELREALAIAPDAAAVASIAQAAGYPISEVDLWLASGTTPDELAATLRPCGAELRVADRSPEAVASRPGAAEEPEAGAWGLGEGAAPVEGASRAGVAEPRAPFHGAAADEGVELVDTASGRLRDALEEARDPGEPAGQEPALEGGRPFRTGGPLVADSPISVGLSSVDVPPPAGGFSSAVDAPPGVDPAFADAGFRVDDGAFAERFPQQVSEQVSQQVSEQVYELVAQQAFEQASEQVSEQGAEQVSAPVEDPRADRRSRVAAAEVIRRFLEEAAADASLRQALTAAPDASAVAAIARDAGHPMTELTLWLASDASFAEVHSQPQAPTSDPDPLTLFLRAVEVDPDLQIALASAPDAATVAAIARIAGFPLTAADLWAASDAAPQELELVVEEMLLEPVVIVEC